MDWMDLPDIPVLFHSSGADLRLSELKIIVGRSIPLPMRKSTMSVYDRALSAAEVSTLYNLEKPPLDLTNGLVAWYPFDGNASDMSGNGNDGTVCK